MLQNNYGHCSVGTFINFVWAAMGSKFWALTCRYGYSVTKRILWKLPKIISTFFFVLSINHTCEFDIFFLGWDVIVQNFSSHSRPYKFYSEFYECSSHFIFLMSLWIKLIKVICLCVLGTNSSVNGYSIKTHSSVSCGPRKRDACKLREYINRNY